MRSLLFIVPLLCFILLSGCYPAPRIPLDTLHYYSSSGDHRQLFVFLPGNGDPIDIFEKNGLLDAVRSRNMAVDVVTVNAHLGYYMKGTVFSRLKEDVIDPAKARGYRKIWIIGNSLGGYGSLSYARQYPEDVTGVVLLGPFLGDRTTIREIRDAGGLQRWEPGEIPRNQKETWERELWKWMKNGDAQKGFWDWIRNCDEADLDCPSRIYLGYGKRDRFSYGQSLMAEILPRENVFVVEGGHNWQTWKKVWDLVLDSMTAEKTGTAVSSLQMQQ